MNTSEGNKPYIALPQLLELVVEEATALKRHATNHERAMLQLGSLDGESYHHCIYGQMTGSCYSRRALDLLQLTNAKAIPTQGSDPVIYESDNTKQHFDDFVGMGETRQGKQFRYFSAIEIYLMTEYNPAALVEYLKGRDHQTLAIADLKKKKKENV